MDGLPHTCGFEGLSLFYIFKNSRLPHTCGFEDKASYQLQPSQSLPHTCGFEDFYYLNAITAFSLPHTCGFEAIKYLLIFFVKKIFLLSIDRDFKIEMCEIIGSQGNFITCDFTSNAN